MGLVESRPGEVLSRTVWSRWLLKQAWPGTHVRQTLLLNTECQLQNHSIGGGRDNHGHSQWPFLKVTVTDNRQQKQEEKKYVCFVVLRVEPKALYIQEGRSSATGAAQSLRPMQTSLGTQQFVFHLFQHRELADRKRHTGPHSAYTYNLQGSPGESVMEAV